MKNKENISDELKLIKNKMKNYIPGVIGKQKEYAVMILLVDTPEGLSFVYEKRSPGVKQPGDVCFPGGRIEDNESIIDCAMRETCEELSLTPSDIEILGQFDSVLEVNRIRIHTVCGVISKETLSKINPSKHEVSQVFTLPLNFFREETPITFDCGIHQDTSNFPYEETGIPSDYNWRVGLVKIYIYHFKDYVIWGITAEISKWFVGKML